MPKLSDARPHGRGQLRAWWKASLLSDLELGPWSKSAAPQGPALTPVTLRKYWRDLPL
jgi:hypothetical protein